MYTSKKLICCYPVLGDSAREPATAGDDTLAYLPRPILIETVFLFQLRFTAVKFFLVLISFC